MKSTEQKILDAAIKVFSEEGYAGATTRKIAQEANITEITLFRKFQTKENLLKEVFIRQQNSISMLNKLSKMSKSGDIIKDLNSLAKQAIKNTGSEDRDSISVRFMFMLFEEGRRRPEIAKILASFFQTNIEYLKEYFECQIKNGKMRNINTKSAALIFTSFVIFPAFLRGIFLDEMLKYNSDSNIDRETENFIDIITKGMLKLEKLEIGQNKEEEIRELKEEIARKREILNCLEEQVKELEYE